MLTLMQAIAKMEGWGACSTNLPTRNNNPGDIVNGAFAQAKGAEPNTPGRFAHFDTPEAGFQALRDLLTKHYVGMTLEAAINRYAPPCENNTTNYVALVSKWTGISPETVLTPELIG